MSSSNSRNPSLDVLRCLLMFGVVMQHTFAVCKFGGVIPYAAYAIYDGLTGPSVDGFASLSGWFGVKCTLKKLYRLACLIFFCGTLHYGIYQLGRFVCGPSYAQWFGYDIPSMSYGYEVYRYWYLGAYAKLLILSIALNPILDAISRFKKVWIALISLAFIGVSYLSLLWFPWVSHSPRTIIFIYIVVRLACMFDIGRVVNENKIVHRMIGLVLLLLFALFAVNANMHCFLFRGYHHPISILSGLLLVVYFYPLKLSSKSLLVRVCSLIAPSMIAVYMLHWNFMDTFFKPVPQFLIKTFPSFPIPLAFFICAVVIFIIVTSLDLARRKCVAVVRPHLPKFLA